ncbi:MAG: hypothetical protein V4574_06260 [Pseudomonadota bacterium]
MAMPTRIAAPSSRSVNSSFTTLFTVQFQHGYYNASGGKCPDFKVVPTPDCANRMASLGMLFKDLGAGFVVLVSTAKVPALINYVLSLYSSETPGAGYWSWLSFLLVPANPDFVGFTSLPITTNPMIQNLHLTNLATATAGDTLTLSGSAGPAAQTLYPVTGPSLSVPVPSGGSATLADLSGRTVSAASTTSDTATSFDLTNLPYGFYTIGFLNASGKVVPPPKGYTAPTEYLYVPASPLSLCVLDLLLAQPAKGIGDADAYPIPRLPVPPTADWASVVGPIQPVTLILPFDARDTYWAYYIVPQGAGQFTADLTISGSGATFAKSTEELPNGDQAVVFTAGTALPLRQVSPYRFKLSGQRQGSNGSRDDIAVNWLPTAPHAPVWPTASGDTLSGSSEIYVYV